MTTKQHLKTPLKDLATDATSPSGVLPFATPLKKLSYKEFLSDASQVYQRKYYQHLDEPCNSEVAYKLVTAPESKLAKHSFLPFISYNKKVRRFGKYFKGFGTRVKQKERPLRYASHKDGYIYRYYAKRIQPIYDQWVKDNHLENNSIAYRKTGLDNIDLAKDAFERIAEIAPCTAYAYDIKSFFDFIPHDTLLANWQTLRKGRLPHGEFTVYKSHTNYAHCDKEELINLLQSQGLKVPPKGRLCSIDNFRKHAKSIVIRNTESYGIPQGSPMSALLSNIVMMQFDLQMKAYIEVNLGGLYKRYSDDILVSLPENTLTQQEVATNVNKLLKEYVGTTLKINDAKTTICSFVRQNGIVATTGITKELDYLGISFNGKRYLIRSSTLSRYWRRLRWKLEVEKRRASKTFLVDRLKRGETKIRRRNISNKFTAQNYNEAANAIKYAIRAANKLGSKAIKKQIKKHRKVISDELN